MHRMKSKSGRLRKRLAIMIDWHCWLAAKLKLKLIAFVSFFLFFLFVFSFCFLAHFSWRSDAIKIFAFTSGIRRCREANQTWRYRTWQFAQWAACKCETRRRKRTDTKPTTTAATFTTSISRCFLWGKRIGKYKLLNSLHWNSCFFFFFSSRFD